MNLLIVNQPLNNRGDESAHKGLIRTLIRELPDIHIQVLFVGADQNSVNQFVVKDKNVEYINLKYVKAYYCMSVTAIRYRCNFLYYFHPTIWKVMSLYKKADWIVCAPGGICMGGFQIWDHLAYLKMAQFMGKRLAYYGRSFGPFPTVTWKNRRFKEISLEMLHYFSFLSIRDKNSEKLANEYHLKYTSTVDTAFLDSPSVEIPKNILKEIGMNKYIVFVPNLLIWHYAYKGRITKDTVIVFFSNLIKKCLDRFPQYKIVMLPQTFNYGTYEGDDVYFFKELSHFIDDERIIVLPDIYSSDIQQSIISNSTLVVGARYHSIVFALNNNVPFIALSYEHKISGLLSTLGKDDCMIDITTLSSKETMENLVTEFGQMLSRTALDYQISLEAKRIAQKCFNEFKCKLLYNK